MHIDIHGYKLHHTKHTCHNSAWTYNWNILRNWKRRKYHISIFS